MTPSVSGKDRMPRTRVEPGCLGLSAPSSRGTVSLPIPAGAPGAAAVHPTRPGTSCRLGVFTSPERGAPRTWLREGK